MNKCRVCQVNEAHPLAKYYSLEFCLACFQVPAAQELRMKYAGMCGMLTIQEMYAVLQSGCLHSGSHEICLACRLEILEELRKLHQLENKCLTT